MPGSSRSAKITLIFDGDDTLWRTMPLYTQAKRRFFDCMEKLGFGRTEVENSFESRDAKNVDRWGFTVERFRRSMVETLEEFLRAKDEIARPRLVERVSHIAGAVSRNKTRQMPGARAVLRAVPKDVEPTALVAFLATYWDLVWVLDEEQRFHDCRPL